MTPLTKRLLSWVLVGLFVAPFTQAQDARIAQQERQRGVVELYETLVPLKSVASFMTVGAHPDDERSSLLALLSQGYGVRTVTVTANRGEGGQNAIGTEYRQALGVLRSREMEEASRAYNVELYFLSESFDDPIYDESFSKSAVETLELWGEDVMMEKLVRAIRESRPDILFTNFQNVFGQHGHHRAMAAATQEAFRLAADPAAYPEQLAMGLEPWQAKKFYLPAGTGGSREAAPEELPTTLSLPVGDYDPIFGASYVQLSEQSRAYHRSQEMGRFLEEGPDTVDLYLADSVVDIPETEDTIFTGIARTVADLAEGLEDETLATQLTDLDAALSAVVDAFPDFAAVASRAAEALELTRTTREAVAASSLAEDTQRDLDFRLGIKEEELQYAARRALSLVARLTLADPEFVPGGSTEATLTAFVGGQTDVEAVALELVAPEGWTVERLPAEAETGGNETATGETAAAETGGSETGGSEAGEAETSAALAYNETVSATFRITAPVDAASYNPYRRHLSPIGANGLVYGVVNFSADGVPMAVEVDDDRLVAVLPEVSIATTPPDLVYNLLAPDTPITLDVALTSYAGPGSTTVSLALPDGWSSEPESADVTFGAKGDTQGASFTIAPPEGVSSGSYDIGVAATGELSSDENVRVVEYEHVGRTYLVTPAAVNLQAFEVAFDPNLRVGYVTTGSDTVYEGLQRIGIDVELLDAATLATGDLSGYDTIMVGIYGYGARPDLAAANTRLQQWVEDGGNLVVQYHRPRDNWDPETTAPYPLTLGSVSLLARVTDQTAPVKILEPENPLMTTPNRITEADFDGWIKERGLYFAEAWDDAYTSMVSITDRQWPDTAEETPFTGPMLTADVGEGRYTYTSLSLHTQIDANVPGAYRLYANLVTPR